MSETPAATPLQTAIESYAKAYGPFAFGIITLLVLWFSIVKPQMDRQALDFDGQSRVTQQLTASIETLRQTANSLEKVASILDEITKRLK